MTARTDARRDKIVELIHLATHPDGRRTPDADRHEAMVHELAGPALEYLLKELDAFDLLDADLRDVTRKWTEDGMVRPVFTAMRALDSRRREVEAI